MISYRLPLVDLDDIVDDSALDLVALSEKQILVTGGSGFVGSWIVEALIRALEVGKLTKSRVTVINRNASLIQKEWANAGLIEIVESDIRFLEKRSLEADVVIHCATPASNSLNRQRPDEMYDIIVNGTKRLLESFVHLDLKFVNLSSGAVYQSQMMPQSCFDEGDPLVTKITSSSAYARGKANVENLLDELALGNELKVVHARLFAFVAPLLPLDTHFAVGNFIGRAIEQKPITVTGDPLTVRSYQYGTDLVRALLRIASKGQPHERFNVGSDQEVTVGDLAIVVQRAAWKVGLEAEVRFEWDGSKASRYVPSVKKLEQVLDFRNTVGLEDAIDRTLRWNVQSRN